MTSATPLPTTRAEWLAQRRTGIGGSDVAAILGLSKWRSPLDVYMDKTADEPAEIPDTASMEWGRRLEPVIREKYAEATGTVVIKPEDTYRGGEGREFMIANYDGIVLGADGMPTKILEIKTARTSAGWGDEGTDEIPEYYITQVQHYLAISGLPAADVAVLIGASDFRIYTVPADLELQKLLIEEERKFWTLVQDRTPPAPRTLAEVQRVYAAPAGGKVEASAEIARDVVCLETLLRRIKESKDEADEVQARICAYMADADTLTIGGATAVTWKPTKPVARLDTAALKAAMPDIYQQYLKLGAPSRRFTLKAA